MSREKENMIMGGIMAVITLIILPVAAAYLIEGMQICFWVTK